jgi:chromate transporter
VVLLAAVFIAIGVLRLPLPAVLLVAIPLSISVTLAMRRRPAA